MHKLKTLGINGITVCLREVKLSEDKFDTIINELKDNPDIIALWENWDIGCFPKYGIISISSNLSYQELADLTLKLRQTGNLESKVRFEPGRGFISPENIKSASQVGVKL